MTVIRVLADRELIMVGGTAYPGHVDPSGALVLAGVPVRVVTLAERNRLVALAELAEPEDRVRQLAASVGSAAAGSDDPAVQAVALDLAGAGGSGSLARTTLLVTRLLGEAAGRLPAGEADRLAESLAGPEVAEAEDGWTTIVYAAAAGGPQPEASDDPGVVCDRLAARLLARAEQPLEPGLLAVVAALALPENWSQTAASDHRDPPLVVSSGGGAPAAVGPPPALVATESGDPGRWAPAPTAAAPENRSVTTGGDGPSVSEVTGFVRRAGAGPAVTVPIAPTAATVTTAVTAPTPAAASAGDRWAPGPENRSPTTGFDGPDVSDVTSFPRRGGAGLSESASMPAGDRWSPAFENRSHTTGFDRRDLSDVTSFVGRGPAAPSPPTSTAAATPRAPLAPLAPRATERPAPLDLAALAVALHHAADLRGVRP